MSSANTHSRMSRRDLLKCAGAALGAGVASTSFGDVDFWMPCKDWVRTGEVGGTAAFARGSGASVTAMAGGGGVVFRAVDANCSVKLVTVGEDVPEVRLEQSMTGGTTWSDYAVGSEISLPNPGDAVRLRAKQGYTNTRFGVSQASYHKFVISGSVASSGNIMSLLTYDESITSLGDSNAFCFMGMFKNCSSLVTAPELPSPTLASGCYREMFFGCSSLTAAPYLPAKTLKLDCYKWMFHTCSSLSRVKTGQSSFTGCHLWLPDLSGAVFECRRYLNIPEARSRDNVPTNWDIHYYGM